MIGKTIDIKASGRLADVIKLRCPHARDPEHPEYIDNVFELTKEQVNDIADRLFCELSWVRSYQFTTANQYEYLLSDFRKAYYLKNWATQAQDGDVLLFG